MTVAVKYELWTSANPTVTRIIPELAAEIGLNESIILLQLAFWIASTNHQVDGEFWTFQSVRDMQQKAFPYWSLDTINRVVNTLAEKNYVKVRDDLNPRKGDNTRWFALNVERLRTLRSVSVVAVLGVRKSDGVSEDQTPLYEDRTPPSEDRTGVYENRTTIPETPSEIPSETPAEKSSSGDADANLPPTTTTSGEDDTDLQEKLQSGATQEVVNSPAGPDPIPPTPLPQETPPLTPAPDGEGETDLVALYRACIEPDPPAWVLAQIEAARGLYQPGWIRYAFDEAAKAPARRNWAYIEAILKRLRREGGADLDRLPDDQAAEADRFIALMRANQRAGADDGPQSADLPADVAAGWTALLERLETELDWGDRTLIRGAQLLGVDGRVWRVGVVSRLAKEKLEIKLWRAVQRALDRVGLDVELHFEVKTPRGSAAWAPGESLAPGMSIAQNA
jgi:hypothetical protein